ncbi:MAG: xanthine dehydrogenase family protein subunit M [Acidisphaera sp.]|nr:xanthine dehydrogenase family protein subunit M [Acidisphaera sp.]
MQSFGYLDPADADAAIAAAAAPGGKFIAGGTDLMQLMKDDVEAPTRIVDVEKLPYGAIEANGSGLRLGALARMSDVAAHPAVQRDYPVIAQALLASASPQLRNMATMGGNMLQRTRCHYFRDTGFPCNKRNPGSGCPAIHGENRLLAILGGSEHCIATHPSDLAVALVALDTSVELQGVGGARRTVALGDFHRLPGDTPQIETVLQPGELITALVVPPSAAARRSAYLKVRDRASFEFALVSAAVALEMQGNTIADARIAMGGVGTKPWRLPAVEAALRGQAATPENFTAAAGLAVEGAMPAGKNDFKVKLMQRTLVRALSTVAA